MEEELTITFYKIHKCGYYKNGKKEFGDISLTLKDISNWAVNIDSFVNTRLWNAEENGSKFADLRQTYFYKYEIDSHLKDCLLVLWNEIPDVKGEVATLSKNKKINDNTHCKITRLPQDAVPGTASYFWFLLDKGYYATVCRKGRSSANNEMRLYLKRFLEMAASCCVREDKSDGTFVLKYKNPNNGIIDSKIMPFFQSSRAFRKGVIEYIQSNRARIKKLIRKQHVSNEVEERITGMKKMLMDLGIKKAEIPEDVDINTRYELEYTPNDAELNDIINNWKSDSLTEYDDTGFVFEGEPDKMHWLSGEISRVRKTFDLNFIDKEIVAPVGLLKELTNNRESLVSILEE
ncbi:MAG: hypothetical protein HDR34_03330 [Treponema sp.]|nr:hypothetical protein [Treponema sp.]